MPMHALRTVGVLRSGASLSYIALTSIISSIRMRPSSGSTSFSATVSKAANPESFNSTLCGQDTTTTATNCHGRGSGARPIPRRCGFPECQKTAKRGGLCISHGGGKKCAVQGCTTSVVSRGFCVAHGGGKRCQRLDCAKSAQSGGFCWIHGGGKKCGYLGCKKRAQSGGACISHGGGKRCRIVGCKKVVQYDGLCVGHGGYRKCISMKCEKRALANGYCHDHGGNSRCGSGGCHKRAVRGGLCADHKSTTTITFACNRPSIDLPRAEELGFKIGPSAVASEQTPRPDLISSTEIAMEVDLAPVHRQAISPLQYVRRSALSRSTMVTPISRQNKRCALHKSEVFPMLPGFETLQSSRCSDKHPGSGWLCCTPPPHFQSRGIDLSDEEWAPTAAPIQTMTDEVVVSLRSICCVADCSRHANDKGFCLLHTIAESQ